MTKPVLIIIMPAVLLPSFEPPLMTLPPSTIISPPVDESSLRIVPPLIISGELVDVPPLAI